MTDIFDNGSGIAVSPSPTLQGIFVPNIDKADPTTGLGQKSPWGGSAFLPRYSVAAGVTTPAVAAVPTPQTDFSQVLAPLMNFVRTSSQQVVTVQGPTGPPGPPGYTYSLMGPPGIEGADGTNGTNGTNGVDAFANIDIPIPYSGWEGGFTNNSPGAGSVAWTSFKLKYQGTEYTITAANTANAFLYWDVLSAPTTLSSSATQVAMGAGKFFVGYNSSGTFYPSQFMKYITAGALFVSQLSAITATLGTVTSGTITLNLGTTYRLRISSSGIEGSVDSGNTYFGIITLDGTDVLIQGTKVKADSIETTHLAANAASSFKTTAVAGPIAYTTGDSTIGTLASFVSIGGMVSLRGQAEVTCTNNPVDNVEMLIYRGTDLVYSETLGVFSSYAKHLAITFEDFPTAGTYTYTLKLNGDAAGGSASTIRFRAYELKK